MGEGFWAQFVFFVNAAVVAATPLLFGTLGEILTEKSGNLNLGVEGLMFMGASAGISASWFYELAAGDGVSGIASAFLAVLAGFLAGALGGLIYSVITVLLRADQNVTGLALTIFGVGLGNFIGEALGIRAGGYASVSEATKGAFAGLHIPGLSDLPALGKLLFSYDFMVYFAVILAIVMLWYLNRSRSGLHLRAVGESPATADSAGIGVMRYKMLATCAGGGICGLGGVYVSMARSSGTWVHNCVNGQGWIAVALVIFAAWNPGRAIFGSLLFGGLSVLRYYLPLKDVSAQIYNIIPFLATVLVLILTSVSQRRERFQPQSCGSNYFREER